ncbi:ML domain-containing protein [Thelonectria olida]|uniref:Phosphatidylglycerol/phosphatidylinositol transfer protein n=1 Tax=Thelonectria olida TaxID=1576542 RepID=A0A9P9AQN5_9HYPO|nr:ML domain-containing protein [Thelonectria olida]
MRFSTVTACLATCLAPAAALSVFNGKAPAIAVDDDLKIPGDSPLELCKGDHAADLVVIDRVDLAPNPPQPGKELVIKASGTVKKTIEKGAYVKIVVKYGLIQLLSTTADLCDEVANVDLECPIKDGYLQITKSVDIPNEIPPGKYTVTADVYTGDDVPITCLTAAVAFSRSSYFFASDL